MTKCIPFYNTTSDDLCCGQAAFVRAAHPVNVVLSLIASPLLVLVILSNRQLRKVRLNVHLVNLAVSNFGFTVCIFLVYVTQYVDDNALHGPVLSNSTKALLACYTYFDINVGYGLVALAADLYMTISRSRVNTMLKRSEREMATTLFSKKWTFTMILGAHLLSAIFAVYFKTVKDIMIMASTLYEAKVKVVLALLLQHIMPSATLLILLALVRTRLWWLRSHENFKQSPYFIGKILRARERSVRIGTAVSLMMTLSSLPMVFSVACFTYIILNAHTDIAGCALYPRQLNQALSVVWIHWIYRIGVWLQVVNSNLTVIVLLLASRYFRDSVVAAIRSLWSRVQRNTTCAIQELSHVRSITELSAQAFHGPCADKCCCKKTDASDMSSITVTPM